MRATWRGVGCLAFGFMLACTTTGEAELRQAGAHRDLAALYLGRGQNEIAIREYRMALKLDDADPESQFGIAEAYRRKGESALAEKHFRSALRHDPTMLDARLNLGALFIGESRWEDAIRENRILLEDPTFLLPERALVNLGWAEYKSGDLGAAEAHYRQAIQSNSRSLRAHLNLGIVLYDRGELVDAVTELEEVLEILRDRPPQPFAAVEAQARFRLGKAYIKLGQRDRALKQLKVASERGGAGEWGERSRDYLRVID